MLANVFAAFAVAVCALLLLRLALGERARGRADARLARAWAGLRRLWSRGRRRAGDLAARPGAERRARREAADAIGRARRGSWEGNVFRPSSFGGGKPDPKGGERRRKNLH